MYTTIIDADHLRDHFDDPGWVIVDCRYNLADRDAGRREYLESHIPGAIYADLHDDLSGPPATDSGRHPLPATEDMNRLFSRLGINHETQIVVYDNAAGSFAARLWWMLRYMGHEIVAVLNGGWQSWLQAGGPMVTGEEKNAAGNFRGHPMTGWLITVDKVLEAKLLVDSRDPARYRGETEPLDRVAGHIPGAINHFWKNNLDDRGMFKSPELLRETFLTFLGATESENAVFYCGSGVTACHNLLAGACARLPASKLYAGSWSEWCSDPARPVATGSD
jgi:thiosulfate/3-mercaptopyruvate sulfurtransferase